MPYKKYAAGLVHILTASGVLCTMFALIAIVDRDAGVTFGWLGLALFIDAIDGPLARLVDTKAHLPRFSGERLDLLIDYLNYVVLPAFMIIMLPVIDGRLGFLACALVLMTSLYHFSDMESKTSDGYFVGFPAIWNIVIFYFLVFKIVDIEAFALVVALSLATFIPQRWLHPLRVVRLRWVTISVVLLWSYVASNVVLADFNASLNDKILLAATAIYLIGLSLRRNFEPIS